jgi:hypothetical protein
MFYVKTLRAWTDNGDKLRSLLHATAATQAIGSLDGLANTWRRLHANRKAFDDVLTVVQLAEALRLLEDPSDRNCSRKGHIFDAMWAGLANANGFGAKTAALFVKAIIDVHTLPENADLRFLEDFRVHAADVVRVPVDSVITYVFRCLTGRKLSPLAINRLIFDSGLHDETQLTLWDDLWFWGFITQHGGGEGRRLGINEAKFWSILASPKDQWPVIKTAAEDFIALLKSAGV